MNCFSRRIPIEQLLTWLVFFAGLALSGCGSLGSPEPMPDQSLSMAPTNGRDGGLPVSKVIARETTIDFCNDSRPLKGATCTLLDNTRPEVIIKTSLPCEPRDPKSGFPIVLRAHGEASIFSRYIFEPSPGGGGWIGDENSAQLLNTTIACVSAHKPFAFPPFFGRTQTTMDGTWSVMAEPWPGAAFVRLTTVTASVTPAKVRATVVFEARAATSPDQKVTLSLLRFDRSLKQWVRITSTIPISVVGCYQGHHCEDPLQRANGKTIEVEAIADPMTSVRLELTADPANKPGLQLWLKEVRLLGPISIPNPDPESALRYLE